MFGIALSLPVVLLIGISLWNFAASESARIETLAIRTAAGIALDVDRKVQSLNNVARVVMASRTLLSGDFPAFQTEIDDVLRRTGILISLSQLRRGAFIRAGTTLGSLGPLPSFEDLSALRQDKAGKQVLEKPTLSGIQTIEGGAKVAILSHMITDVGATPGTSNISLDVIVPVEQFRELLDEPPTTTDVVSLIDQTGRIVARNRRHEEFAGMMATPDLIANTTGTQGTWSGRTIDGREIVGAYARAPVSDWRIAIGISKQELSLPYMQSIVAFLTISTILLGVAVLLAMSIGQRIVGSVRKLTRSAAAVDRGELTNRLDTPILEVNDVSAELANASSDLLNYTRSLAANAARLKAIYETDPVGILVAEAPSGRIIEGNHAVASIYKYPVIHSASVDEYNQWIAFHHDGTRVESNEHPLYRVLKMSELRPELECQALRGDGTKAWIRIIGAPLHDVGGKMSGALVAIVDIDDAKRAEDDQRLMNRELHHRVKNTLATVLAITNLTTRSATDIITFRKSFADRIMSLSRTHTLLIENSWSEIPLQALIQGELEPYVDHAARQITIKGDDIALPSDTALALGMAFHELTTNAVKYGALSNSTGHLLIEWHMLDDEEAEGTPAGKSLTLTWIETGGPLVSPPATKGFGSQLLRQILARQLKGEVDMTFRPEGLCVHIHVPG